MEVEHISLKEFDFVDIWMPLTLGLEINIAEFLLSLGLFILWLMVSW